MEEMDLFRSLYELEPEELAKILKSQEGESPREAKVSKGKREGLAMAPFMILLGMVLLVLMAGILYPGDAGYMELGERSLAPYGAHIFGTDTLGRDVFGMVLHGGRISMLVGLLATLVSTAMAVTMGSFAALLPEALGNLVNRLMELFLSVPSILLMIFIQAILGGSDLFSISMAIGLSSWMTLAKVVKTQIEGVKGEEYVFLARYQGGGFLYLMRRHFLPALMPVVLYMSFTGFGHAMAAETTLSFLGMGFPVGTVTWGTLLSLSGQALLTRAWWVILIPGVFLVLTVVSLVEIGDILRKRNGIQKKL